MKKDGSIGFPIGVIEYALVRAQKNLPSEESWKLIIKAEMENLTVLLRKYERENEFVWHEKIPDSDELPTLESKLIASIICYEPQKWERDLVFNL